MENLIIASPEKLRELLKELFTEFVPNSLHVVKEPSETMSLPMVLDYLSEKGYPTSKSKIYQLTCRNEMPHRKYGNKLVFVRTEIEQWMESQTVKKRDSKAEALRVIAEGARRKMNSPARKKK